MTEKVEENSWMTCQARNQFHKSNILRTGNWILIELRLASANSDSQLLSVYLRSSACATTKMAVIGCPHYNVCSVWLATPWMATPWSNLISQLANELRWPFPTLSHNSMRLDWNKSVQVAVSNASPLVLNSAEVVQSCACAIPQTSWAQVILYVNTN